MRLFSILARLVPALIVACALTACGGGSDTNNSNSNSGFVGGLPATGTNTPSPAAPTPADDGVAVVKRCAP
ncbi:MULTISPECIES: hypothetical protein [unclassified Variovorax]|uniref:hypothetical protein n=1 Tax=unclassified Variovorax TaxID=663243 RepID=UPI003F457BDD